MNSEEIRHRLQKILNTMGKTVNSVAGGNSALQVKLNRQIRGTSTISTDTICLMVELFPTLNLDWLFTGRGEMLKDTNSSTHVVANGESSVAAMNSSVSTAGGQLVDSLKREIELKDQVIEEKERLIKVLMEERK